MRKKISVDECKKMFEDRFSELTMKEIGIELKHFSLGTAPEAPSFLVNQEKLKNKLIELFCTFFNPERSQGLELIYLKSNYGNGKSHFIRMIHHFLSSYENVITKMISLKQEETDFEKIILGGISQKLLKECASFLVRQVEKEVSEKEEICVLNELSEKYQINIEFAKLLYQAVKGGDAARQIQAIAILKGDYLSDYPKTFGLKKTDLNSDFYYKVIRLLCSYLKQSEQYFVIVLDEYEHVFSWKNERSRKKMYQDIKQFLDDAGLLEHMFIIFAESDSVNNESESSDDPAFKSRKSDLIYPIEDISSSDEIKPLFEKILKRYEKYYGVDLEAYMDEMLLEVNKDQQIKEKTHYRGYTKAIIRVLDRTREELPKSDLKRTEELQTMFLGQQEFQRWAAGTSIAKKTGLCELVETMAGYAGEEVLYKSKKQGIYCIRKQQVTKRIFIMVTEKPKVRDLIRRLNALSSELHQEEKKYILYPEIEQEVEIHAELQVIFYNDDTVEGAFREMLQEKNTRKSHSKSMESYLSILDVRGQDAQDKDCKE